MARSREILLLPALLAAALLAAAPGGAAAVRGCHLEVYLNSYVAPSSIIVLHSITSRT
jgi:hypothetical protein